MNVIRTDGNFLEYNDVADQFVVVWLGIVAINLFLVLEFGSEQPLSNSIRSYPPWSMSNTTVKLESLTNKKFNGFVILA